MIIRHASLEDLPRILTIKEAATKHLHHIGINQWNDYYPNKTVFTEDINRQELYVLLEDHTVIGFACINQSHSEEYGAVNWKLSTDDAFCVHRLAVDPTYHGKGIGSRLMRYAEELAREANVGSLRVDTFSENFITQKLFGKFGYSYVGDVFYGPVKKPFYCYEKQIVLP